MALGFMPCGLVFAAVMAVTATANPLLAAIAMAAFGLGTIPALLGISLGSSVFLRKRKNWLQPFSTAMMFANSFILFLIAGGWKI
jgi:sulfite exporter TauE/SafE